MSLIKFSIIIPVYNISNYISECVNSVLKQSFKDYEIILVNDGSIDDSFNICLNYSKKHENVRLINQQNGGLSSARNAGINQAEGDYLLFLDGDDFWKDGEFLENLNCIIETNSPDTIIFLTLIITPRIELRSISLIYQKYLLVQITFLITYIH